MTKSEYNFKVGDRVIKKDPATRLAGNLEFLFSQGKTQIIADLRDSELHENVKVLLFKGASSGEYDYYFKLVPSEFYSCSKSQLNEALDILDV
jgi:hypothetical protein